MNHSLQREIQWHYFCSITERCIVLLAFAQHSFTRTKMLKQHHSKQLSKGWLSPLPSQLCRITLYININEGTSSRHSRFIVLVSHMGVQFLTTLFLFQLPATLSGKAAEDGEELMLLPPGQETRTQLLDTGFGLAKPCLLQSF